MLIETYLFVIVVEYKRQGEATVMLATQMKVIVIREDRLDILGWSGCTIAKYLYKKIHLVCIAFYFS